MKLIATVLAKVQRQSLQREQEQQELWDIAIACRADWADYEFEFEDALPATSHMHSDPSWSRERVSLNYNQCGHSRCGTPNAVNTLADNAPQQGCHRGRGRNDDRDHSGTHRRSRSEEPSPFRRETQCISSRQHVSLHEFPPEAWIALPLSLIHI